MSFQEVEYGVEHGFSGSSAGTLNEVGVGAKLHCTEFVFVEIGAGVDQYQELRKGRPRPQPFEDLKSVEARHLEIEDEGRGDGKNPDVAVRRIALKIVNGFLTIPDETQLARKTCAGEGMAKKEHVVLTVVGNQDRSEGFNHGYAARMASWQLGRDC